MKYLVTGQNRETGARMTLEFEADSRAAAERKAAGAGMDVHRVDDVTPVGAGTGTAFRRPGARKCYGWVWLLLLLLVTVAAWYAWQRGMLPLPRR